jgi:hypothetical protein
LDRKKREDNMNTSSSSSSTFIGTIKKSAIVTALTLAAGLSVFSAQAEMSPMETIQVTNRTPFEYALYLQTTEMLAKFHTGLEEKNIRYARHQSLAMAEEYDSLTASSVLMSSNNPYANNHLLKERVLEAAQ